MGTGLVEVTNATPAGHWRLRLVFSDGFTGTADLSFLEGRGVFGPLSDPAYFDQVRVDRELGTVVWPNGADIAAQTLRERTSPATPAGANLADEARSGARYVRRHKRTGPSPRGERRLRGVLSGLLRGRSHRH